ncbi:phospholipid-translocating ATPase [Athelia psychrophila]|uniref:Phospholipid-transporting ATPase n=1 Tax=Athelia psychrophila TaxID=1759441 RepID=A0A166GY78_9AGAM|nr:phospholipid-translocating ATPase [Fibularhizoctonia sp. CBS 109695]
MAAAGISSWYKKVAAFNVESLFSSRRPIGPPRAVYLNENLPADYHDAKGRPKKEHVYCTNQVITSKYTIITFLPRNLLEQFRRVANVFFLGIAILQFFPKFSTISPGLVILPLLIVLGITAIKDAYEDVKRHQSDRKVNHTEIRVLAGGEDGGWVNPNLMERKAKTFVRGFVPKSVAKGSAKAARVPEGVKDSMDTEMLAHGAPEAVVANGSTAPPEHELDDDDESTAHHLFSADAPTRPHWRKTLWEDVRVGDFVKVLDNESFPADILICATSEEENVAFVETKNLDGETNLKSRNAVPALTHLRSAAACASKENAFRVDLDRPDVNMYKLAGAVVAGEEKHAVDINMTLLRGTVLRNTRWAVGIVIYTGQDTKIVLNSGGTPSKRSKVERMMNPQVFMNLIVLAIMAVVCAIADSILEKREYIMDAPWLYLDDRSNDNPKINGLITWAFALITFQNIVPISLYISVEAVRTCQAAFIYFDKDIWYEKTNQATLARTWNLSDDLGQIEYIFSDKTGTLTQNSMVFRQCSIGGKVYKGDADAPVDGDSQDTQAVGGGVAKGRHSDTDTTASIKGQEATPDPLAPSATTLPKGVLTHFHDQSLKDDLASSINAESGTDNAAHARMLNGFFSVLALCHTVLTAVDPVTGAIEYKAQSPDEAALVQAAADCGFVFRGRDKEILRLQTPFSEAIERYELLNILEFTSARKRMSVVLRKLDTEDQRLFLLTKGADNVIFERLKEGSEELKNVTEKQLDDFANDGLRTLTLAYKVISEDEYEKWSQRYHDASVTLDDREGQIEKVSEELERDLRLLGATAIEDRLQDGVPEAIADLKRAGIKIWVATGDKLETAIAIGHSTNLIGKESNIIIVRGGNQRGRPVYEQMLTAVEDYFPESGILQDDGVIAGEAELGIAGPDGRPFPMRRVNTGISSIVGADNGDRPGGFVLVIDGAALEHALADEQNKHLLLRLATQCEGVVCCRVSPLQKALVVKLVKDGLGAMTLAIGDGANDVSMIQAADVGVGISGEEGLQAVNSSDYAIAQFRFLKRLLLVHGHWSYARNGTMISNFFYKNMICIGVLWWFQIYCAWSANYVLEYTYLLFWNSFWTIAPVIGIGVFDRFTDDSVLMALPELYRYGREGKWFTQRQFAVYMIDAVYQSAIIYFIVQFAYLSPTPRTDGFQVGLYEYSTTMAISAVLAANLFCGLNTTAWTGWIWFATFLGIVLIWLYTAIYSVVKPAFFATGAYGNDHYLFESAYFWLCLPITIIFALLPRYLAKAYKFGYMPDDIDIVRWNHTAHPERDIGKDAYYDAPLQALKGPRSSASIHHATPRSGSVRPISIAESVATIEDHRRPSMSLRAGSRTDMSTGLASVHRGFDFATEEGGVAMRRIQTNLSERRASSRNLPLPDAPERKGSRIFSLRRHRKKSTTQQPSSPRTSH